MLHISIIVNLIIVFSNNNPTGNWLSVIIVCYAFLCYFSCIHAYNVTHFQSNWTMRLR